MHTRLQTYNMLSGMMWSWWSFSSTTRDKKVLLGVSHSLFAFSIVTVYIICLLFIYKYLVKLLIRCACMDVCACPAL